MRFLLLRFAAFVGLLAYLSLAASAQQPELPQQPAAPAGPPATRPVQAPPIGPELVLGHTYRVETTQGTTFTGQLISMSLVEVEFDSPELGRITLLREQLRRVTDQNPALLGVAQRPSYFDIGNGNRLFNAPTGRTLRKGEGTVLSTYLVFVGGEYGITDNISIQASASLIPTVPLSEQLFVISPRFSVPLNEELYVGGGLIYANISIDGNTNGTAGIVYGAATYGGADTNLTLGVGYAFAGGDLERLPIFQLGGQKRISRRTSLISENYIVAEQGANGLGLYGVKFHWPRTSLGLAALYAYESFPGGTDFATTYVIPVYIDFAYRFGKTR